MNKKSSKDKLEKIINNEIDILVGRAGGGSLEAAYLGKKIFHGKYIQNFPDVYKILEQLNENEIIVRFVINAPFPIKDRDSVNRVFVQQTDKDIKITLESTPKFIPHNNKQIRMTVSSGKWTLEKKGNQTRVTLEYHADPEIPIPSWVSNRYVVQGPATSLSNLKKRLN